MWGASVKLHLTFITKSVASISVVQNTLHLLYLCLQNPVENRQTHLPLNVINLMLINVIRAQAESRTQMFGRQRRDVAQFHVGLQAQCTQCTHCRRNVHRVIPVQDKNERRLLNIVFIRVYFTCLCMAQDLRKDILLWLVQSLFEG
jgi:hypothetical protein